MRGFASKQEEIWHLKVCEGNDQSLCSRNQQISDVIYGQVWWAMLGIHALHLPIQSAHTHCKHTHCKYTPRAVGGSAPQSWYWGWREHWIFTPPTYNSCWPETRTRNLWISPALKPLGFTNHSPHRYICHYENVISRAQTQICTGAFTKSV